LPVYPSTPLFFSPVPAAILEFLSFLIFPFSCNLVESMYLGACFEPLFHRFLLCFLSIFPLNALVLNTFHLALFSVPPPPPTWLDGRVEFVFSTFPWLLFFPPRSFLLSFLFPFPPEQSLLGLATSILFAPLGCLAPIFCFSPPPHHPLPHCILDSFPAITDHFLIAGLRDFGPQPPLFRNFCPPPPKVFILFPFLMSYFCLCDPFCHSRFADFEAFWVDSVFPRWPHALHPKPTLLVFFPCHPLYLLSFSPPPRWVERVTVFAHHANAYYTTPHGGAFLSLFFLLYLLPRGFLPSGFFNSSQGPSPGQPPPSTCQTTNSL